MSAPRLTFLYPTLFQLPRTLETPGARNGLNKIHSSARRAGSRNARRLQSNFAQRYGPAAEPIPPPNSQGEQKQQLLPALPVSDLPPNQAADKPPRGGAATLEPAPSTTSRIDADTQPDRRPLVPSDSIIEAGEPTNSDADFGAMTELAVAADNPPLDRVLQLEPPSGMKTGASQIPHLHTPPYVHHFDTYTLVNDLQKGGFSQAQSITVMKAVRSLLADNMDLAREGIVSKSDSENEGYLFRAACSELRTEIQHARHRTISRQRSDLAHLQHDADILNQRVTQELQTLRDELKGLFNDRKMNVREEQRRADVAIQDLHRQINVDLLGDGKGSVEGLRWFLTRRAAFAIGIAALLTLGSIRYTTYVSHQEEIAREKHAKEMKNAGAQTDDGSDGFVSGSGPRSDVAAAAGDSDEVLASVNGKSGAGQHGVSYVSLG